MGIRASTSVKRQIEHFCSLHIVYVLFLFCSFVFLFCFVVFCSLIRFLETKPCLVSIV